MMNWNKASKIPTDLVYRLKQGFEAPLEKQFNHTVFLDHLHSLLNSNAPLYTFISKNLIKQALDLVKDEQLLPFQTYNFLWGITFNNSWLSQLKSVIKELKIDDSIRIKN
jgi:hypothetical protein